MPIIVELSELRTKLKANFDIMELKILCQDLKINYEEFPSNTLSVFVVNLLWYVAEHGQLKELLAKVQQERPKVQWPSSPKAIHYLENSLRRNIRWGKFKKLLPMFITILVLVIGFFIMGWLILRPNQIVEKPVPSNFYSDLLGLKLDNVELQKLSMDPNSDRMWVSGYDKKSKTALLYYIDTSKKADAKLHPVNNEYLKTGGRIYDLHIDCIGNIWILLEKFGPLIIRFAEGLNQTESILLENNLSWPKNNEKPFHTTSTCRQLQKGTEVEVFFAHKKITSIKYLGGNLHNSLNLSPPISSINDQIPTDANIRYLFHDRNSKLDIVWAISNNTLLGFSPSNMWDTISCSMRTDVFSLSIDKEKEIWVGGNHQIYHATDFLAASNCEFSILANDQISANIFKEVVSNNPWIWVGGICGTNIDDECFALGIVDSSKKLVPVKFDHNQIRDIEIDNQHRTWFSTENGLVFYDSH